MKAHEARVFHKLQRAAHALHKLADREIAAATDLTTAQAAVLSVLATGEGTNQSAVAAALGQNESAVTAMVSRLVSRGYVSRARSARDARAWELSITKEGRAALRATKRPFSKINELVDDELSPSEVLALADLLERLSSLTQ